MALGNFVSNQGTQTGIIVDTIGTSVMAIQKLDISPLGADGTIWGGNVGVSSGTITTLPNIPGGTINNVASGTINSATAVLNSGTINVGTFVMPSGTVTVLPNLPQGSINVTSGTINTGTINIGTSVGKDANAAAQTGNPQAVGGTDSGGTIRTIKVDSGGLQRIGLDSGTISVLPNLPQGSINVTAGTVVMPSGTISVLPNLPQGSINVTAGTVNAGTINIGTSVGKDANAAAQTGNPQAVGGTDSGGTIRTIKVDSGGLQRVGLDSGTISVLPNLPGGSIVITAGTQNVGTVNTGTINTGTINTGTINAGTINAGTIQINPLVATNTISHAGTSGTLGIGTLVTAATMGAGTACYITNYRIVAISGTPEVILAFGTQTNGNQVIHHGLFPAGGGIASPVPYPHGYGTTNSPLTFQILSGAGTVSWDVDYFVHT